MGQIVTNGRAQRASAAMRVHGRPSIRGLHAKTTLDGRRLSLETYSRKKCLATSEDLALVQQRFGVNISEALQLSLHLTAEMIRLDKALPRVPK